MNNSTSQDDVLNDFDELIILLKSNDHFKYYLYFLIVFNSLSAILAAVFNFLIILSFVKTSSLRTPSFILILSLAISDLGVGVATQPAYCCRLIAWLMNNPSLYKSNVYISTLTANVLITVSFLMVTFITIDRFLAVQMHLRYQQLVTVKRSYLVVIIVWILSLAWSFVALITITWLLIINEILTLVIVILNVYLMLRIPRIIRKHEAQSQAQQQPVQPQRPPAMNIQRYKKSVKTMHYVTSVFLLCFLPSYITLLVYYGQIAAGDSTGIEMQYAIHSAYTLVLINSALNPFIYCWRIEKIRNALVQMLRRQSP